MNLVTRLAVLAAAAAAFVVPVSAPASATPITCRTQASLDKFGTTVIGTCGWTTSPVRVRSRDRSIQEILKNRTPAR